MNKQELIAHCAANSVPYQFNLNSGKLRVMDATQLPETMRALLDVNGVFIEAKPEAKPKAEVKAAEPKAAEPEVEAPVIRKGRTK